MSKTVRRYVIMGEHYVALEVEGSRIGARMTLRGAGVLAGSPRSSAGALPSVLMTRAALKKLQIAVNELLSDDEQPTNEGNPA